MSIDNITFEDTDSLKETLIKTVFVLRNKEIGRIEVTL